MTNMMTLYSLAVRCNFADVVCLPHTLAAVRAKKTINSNMTGYAICTINCSRKGTIKLQVEGASSILNISKLNQFIGIDICINSSGHGMPSNTVGNELRI